MSGEDFLEGGGETEDERLDGLPPESHGRR